MEAYPGESTVQKQGLTQGARGEYHTIYLVLLGSALGKVPYEVYCEGESLSLYY